MIVTFFKPIYVTVTFFKPIYVTVTFFKPIYMYVTVTFFKPMWLLILSNCCRYFISFLPFYKLFEVCVICKHWLVYYMYCIYTWKYMYTVCWLGNICKLYVFIYCNYTVLYTYIQCTLYIILLIMITIIRLKHHK